MRNWLQAPLSYVIRYFFPGVIAFFYFYLLRPEDAKTAWENFGHWGVLLLCALLGTLIHLVYRSTIYNQIILCLQDTLRNSSDNYRTYFRKMFSNEYRLGTKEGQFLYHQVKMECIGGYSEEMQVAASGIHLLYVSGIMSFFMIFIHWWAEGGLDINQVWFLLTFLLLFGSGILSDRYYETVELGFIKRVHPNKLISVAESLLNKKSIDQQSESMPTDSTNDKTVDTT